MWSRRAFLGAPAFPLACAQQGGVKMFGNAEAYERFMGRWSRLVAPLLIDFAGVPPAGRVLDVGSGTGALANELVRLRTGVSVTGVDPSQEYISFAASRSAQPDRTTFQKGDAQALSFPDRTFDASLSLLVFNFIPDPARAIHEVRRVTKPGGPVSAAVWDYGGGMRMLRAFWNAAVRINAPSGKLDEKHMPLCRAGELASLWRKDGLTAVHEQPLDITMRFRNFADYWDPFLLGQGPAGAYVRQLDPKALEALRTALMRELSISSEAAPFTLPARVWAVRGTVPPQ